MVADEKSQLNESEESNDINTDDSSQETPKKKSGIALKIIIAMLVLYAILGGIAIYLQGSKTDPMTAEGYSATTEMLASEIVTAHNELMRVNPEGYFEPGEKIGAVKRTFAANELNKRIKIMRTNTEKLNVLTITPDDTSELVDAQEEIQAFALFIQTEWIPFWEMTEEEMGDVATAEDAYALWDRLNATLDEGLGAVMSESFRSLARVGKELGWNEDSYRARIWQ